MIPGEIFARRIKRSYITYLLIIINTIIYMATSYSDYFITADPNIYWEYTFIPGYLGSLNGWFRIFTSMFLHANIIHIFFNMYFLYIFGRYVESFLGSVRYALLYLISGFIAAMMHTSMIPVEGLVNLGISALGASGAISGVLGAFLLLYPGARMTFCIPIFIIPFCGVTSSDFFILFWFALQVIYGLLQVGSVAFFAHVGGFLAGIVLVYVLGRNLVSRESYLYGFFNRFSEGLFGLRLSRRGLGSISRTVLLVLIIIVVVALIYSAFLSLAEAYVYPLHISASVSTSGGVMDSRAVIILVLEKSSSQSIVAPIVSDIIRVLFNRLYSAGYIVNSSLAGYSGGIYYKGYIEIVGVKAPPVYLELQMSRATYDSLGVILYGSGSASTDLLNCNPYGVCSLSGLWRYSYFEINSLGLEILSKLMLIPMTLSFVISIGSLIIVLGRYDQIISLSTEESIFS
ncbi:MAG: rhomboid family intramembrane serine protease [Sulfolobales archaeon]